MKKSAELVLKYWEIGTKWGDTETSVFGERLGFWLKDHAEAYLQALMDADPIKAAAAKALDIVVMERRVTFKRYLFAEDFDKTLLQLDIDSSVRKQKKLGRDYEYSAEEERWEREAEWKWVWELGLEGDTPQGGTFYGGLGRVYLDNLNADHACYLSGTGVPKNVKARLAYEVPRAMYAEYIAPVMKKIREEREAKKNEKENSV